ncbi:methenyltetrahydromethanopterin cyclohydrolase [Rhodopirellula sp. SWK7]|uniref:methenyltetrahydromethanopterin cyclohydrolase n=1 Tax=Rhodopirellula sp. SWK7 TaxID=595460 RepID=UPI0002BF05F2|nr:methenyltetrahydromethanopterin cyclohydrolase [Rhodopirellula sp. SWK7]EMI47188.1 N(5),N(10)-methenyltetrahydromethanopterin cyclohydrolase [Rhodopirellula sp. SWK7]
MTFQPAINAARLHQRAHTLFDESWKRVNDFRAIGAEIGGAKVLDCGIACPGSLHAGLLLARFCLGDGAAVSIGPAEPKMVADNAVFVRTDQPIEACLGGQYAGWPVSVDKFFAMGSGPMRMLRGREEILEHLGLVQSAGEDDFAVGVLESDRMPDEDVIAQMASECGVTADRLCLGIAPSTSIAGSVQVVARSIETALHKLHALDFDVAKVVSATGVAPLPPCAKPGDTVGGIGRTNDAMLYGAKVTLWIDAEDEAIDAVAEKVPSRSSGDFGQPFAKIFKQYDYDFYKVDPMLFSPAVVTIHSLASGRTWRSGELAPAILRDSFGFDS